MQFFKEFLTEAKSKAISHLTHLAGEEHFNSKEASDADIDKLENLHKYLNGEKSSVSNVGYKADGSPSFEMGHIINPKTGEKEFGVAYKGAAKGYAFDEKDIEQKFGHSEGLKSKMSQLLEHGRKIISPLHGIVQGDFMGSKKDGTIKKDEGKITHKENLITYGYDANSDEGKSLNRAKISLALHTRIDKDTPEYNIDTSKLHSHPDVHLFNTKLQRSGIRYDEDAKEEFQSHLNKAKQSLSNIKDHDGLIEGHSEHLQTYINRTVRDGSLPSVQGYKSHLKERLKKEVDRVKTPATKQRKTEYMEHMIDDVENNSEGFKHLFTAHKHLDNARNVVLNALESSKYTQEHTINGMKTKPEGFVVGYKDGSVSKVVNRSKEGFSGLNLNK